MSSRVLVSNFFYKNKYYPTSSHDYSGFLAITQAKINDARYNCIDGKLKVCFPINSFIYR